MRKIFLFKMCKITNRYLRKLLLVVQLNLSSRLSCVRVFVRPCSVKRLEECCHCKYDQPYSFFLTIRPDSFPKLICDRHSKSWERTKRVTKPLTCGRKKRKFSIRKSVLINQNWSAFLGVTSVL